MINRKDDDLGFYIRMAREQKGMTQALLAEKIGIGFRSISRWELNYTRPSDEDLLHLSRILEYDFSPFYLYQGCGSLDPQEDEEIKLLKIYRQLTPCTKNLYLKVGMLFLTENKK